MNGWLRSVWTYLLVAICGVAISCSSSSPAERSPAERASIAESNLQVSPSMEVRPYLVDSTVDLIVKATPDNWHRVRPLVEDVLAGELTDPSTVEQTGPSANRPQDSKRALLDLFGNLTGYDLELEHLAGDRPAYLLMTPTRHQPSQGCLSAGLPCTLMSSPGPRYGRVLLPTDDPGALVEEIRAELGRGLYVTVPHKHHVRVEFATAIGERDDLDAIAEHLEVRSQDRPMDLFDRRTPARSALVDAEVPFGLYVDLRSAIDAAMYLEQWKLYQQMDEWPTDGRMRRLFDATVSIARLTQMDRAPLAETEDVTLLVGGQTGAGYSMDLVSTRTALGAELAGLATSDVSLPPVTVESPSLTLEWNLQFDAIDELQKPAEWVTPAPGPRRDVLAEVGGWGAIGVLRSPMAVALKLGTFLEQQTGGFDLDRILAGRLRLDRVDADSGGKLGLKGGGALLLAPGRGSEAFVDWFRSVSRFAGALETDIARQTDGKIEVRFGLRMPVSEVVDTSADPRPVDRFTVRADPSTATRLVETFVGRRMSASETSIDRVVSALARRGTLRFSHQSTREWYAARLGIARDPDVPLSIRPVEFSTRQPRAVCLDAVARETAGLLEDALASGATDTYLADQLTSRVTEFRNAIADCGGAGQAEAELADWAVEYFNGWHALVEYRAGNDIWSNRLLHVCDDGREWACNPTLGEWPWIGRGETAR